jgi:protoporphyrin/coproporphyrin ferrochelatase
MIERGDPYPQEVGASVHEVLKDGAFPNPYPAVYQSEVGPVRWLGASTERVIKDLGAKGQKNVLVVGIAFTSDHIETLVGDRHRVRPPGPAGGDRAVRAGPGVQR